MSRSPITSESATYSRTSDIVFRWVRGSVGVRGSHLDTMAISGAAALVWMVLDSPADPEEIAQRIRLDWAQLGSVDSDLVAEALELLVDQGLLSRA